MYSVLICIRFFFFQAEDGIRYRNVTGVQTCALPICVFTFNVVPHECKYTVDVRVNELYTFEEVLDIIRNNVKSDVQPRSSRLRSTSIPVDHPLIEAGVELGRTYYGSPTTSDKALMNFPTLKMGPGDSARSHTADEFIYVDEIANGIDLYIQLLNKILR